MESGGDEDRQAKRGGGGVEASSRPRYPPREESLESARGPGAEESQCIIVILSRLRGASKWWVVLVKHPHTQKKKGAHIHKHTHFFSIEFPQVTAPAALVPSDFLALFM